MHGIAGVRLVGLCSLSCIALVACGIFPGMVAVPALDPPPGIYNRTQTVTISTNTPDAAIRYATDGDAPTSSSGIEYTGPVTIARTETLRAIGSKTGMGDSAIVTALYTISSGSTPTPLTDATAYVTETGTKYHRAGCRYVAHSCTAVLLSAAKSQGYAACSVCNPPRSVARTEAPQRVFAAVPARGRWALGRYDTGRGAQ